MPLTGIHAGQLDKRTHGLDQSHYKEVLRWEIFYGTGIEIWAGFGPVGITERKQHLG